MVTEAIWNEEGGIWEITGKNVVTSETFTDTCDVLINGSGILK